MLNAQGAVEAAEAERNRAVVTDASSEALAKQHKAETIVLEAKQALEAAEASGDANTVK